MNRHFETPQASSYAHLKPTRAAPVGQLVSIGVWVEPGVVLFAERLLLVHFGLFSRQERSAAALALACRSERPGSAEGPVAGPGPLSLSMM